MKILENIAGLFVSPRFITFYINTGLIAGVGLFSLISENLGGLGLPEWAVVLIGLAIAQITKALNNLKQGKDMGFAPKE